MRITFPACVVALIFGLTLGSWIREIPLLFAVAAGLTFGAFLMRGNATRIIRSSLLLVLFAFLGVIHAARITPGRLPNDHVIHHTGKQKVSLEGVIIKAPEIRRDCTRFVLRAERVRTDLGFYGTRGLVMMSVRRGGERFQYGDRIRVSCSLSPPQRQGNPGAFSWRRYLALRGIFVTGFVWDGRSILLIRHNQGNWLKGAVERARRTLADFIRREFPMPARELMLAMVVGERWAVKRSHREAFAALGIAHLLAISGLHLGLIAVMCYGVMRWLLLRIPGLALRVSVEKVAWIPVLPGVVGYACIAGMGTSTQRALIMILSLVLALIMDRRHNLYHALSLAALIVLLVDPAAIYDLSFQLSFLAVLGIVYAVPKWEEAIFRRDPLAALEPKRRRARILRWVVLLGLSSTAALLATLPVSLLHFHRFPVVSLPANLLIVPLIGFVALPVSLVGAACFFIWPQGGSWVLWISAWLFQGVNRWIQEGSQLLGPGVYLPSPRFWEVALFYGICVCLCHLHRIRWARWSALGLLGALLAIWAGESVYRLADTGLRLHCISVGNGVSILVEGPGGYRMLVDGGGTYDDRADIGALQVAPVLWHRRVMALDRVILSHPHPDHMNGLRYVLRAFRVHSLWDNGDRPRRKAYQEFEAAALEKGLFPRPLDGGMQWRMREALVQVLHPPERSFRAGGEDLGSRANNASVVLRVSLGKVSFLIPGDIEAEAERWLVGTGRLRSTVLVAPHHGSRTSSTMGFIKAVSPRCVVFSSRAGTAELVNPRVRDRYERLGVRCFHTGEAGMVSFSTDGETLAVTTYLSRRNDMIRLRP